MVVWNRPRGIRSQDWFFVFPRWGKSNNAFRTRLDGLRQPAFFRCLEKAFQNCGMKPTSWNSIPRLFFRFLPMGRAENTRFERDWTTLVNTPFCAPWKSPPKMVVWNRPRGIRSEGFFRFPGRGRSKKRVLNAIRRPPSTCFCSMPRKAHPKWWYETDRVRYDPNGVFSFLPDGESRKDAVRTSCVDLVLPDLYRYLEKPTQNGDMKPTSWESISRLFFRFALMGKVEKSRLECVWKTFV